MAKWLILNRDRKNAMDKKKVLGDTTKKIKSDFIDIVLARLKKRLIGMKNQK